MTVFVLLILSVCAVGAILSGVKKLCKRTFHKILLMLISVVLSLFFGFTLSLVESFGMGYWSVLFYGLCIFGLQYVMSQELLDSIFKKLIERLI